MSRRIVAVSVSIAVIAAVAVIIALALIPLPEFPPAPQDTLHSSIAFVSDDNCVVVADLATGAKTELRCEPEQRWIDEMKWTAQGVEVTAYLNQPTTRILDPRTGIVVETLTGDDVLARPPSQVTGLVVDRPEVKTVIIYDENDRKLLELKAPERYWVDPAIPSPDGTMVSIVDTQARLAVFDRSKLVPYLIADEVRSWPAPAWAP